MYQSRRQDFDRDLDSATMQKCVSQPKDVDAVELHAICPSGECSECLVTRKLTTISHLEWCMSLLHPRHQQLWRPPESRFQARDGDMCNVRIVDIMN